jgi:hypothetical protein
MQIATHNSDQPGLVLLASGGGSACVSMPDFSSLAPVRTGVAVTK